MENNSKTIISLYQKHGQEEYGEKVTQLSHAVQAGLSAKEKNFDEELVLAAFLHDIGHLVPLSLEGADFETMGNYGIEQHDLWGEHFLKDMGFSERLIATVSNHVNAKRYLCAVDQQYHSLLSDASKATLKYQGGPMTPAEVSDFEANPFFEDSIKIRKVDEAAKIENFEIKEEDLSYFYGLIKKQFYQK